MAETTNGSKLPQTEHSLTCSAAIASVTVGVNHEKRITALETRFDVEFTHIKKDLEEIKLLLREHMKESK